tara:strand:- start:1351 stop:1458 length:108 start_codon:yes stop_codon:yes gene_type:complete
MDVINQYRIIILLAFAMDARLSRGWQYEFVPKKAF